MCCACWNDDGTRIVSGSFDKTLIIWDPVSGEKISTLIGHSRGINSVAWTADGVKIVSGSFDKTVIEWDVMTGKAIFEYAGHTGDVFSVSLSPDGRKIVSGGGSLQGTDGPGEIFVWDCAARTRTNFQGHDNIISCVSWSPDGSKIASGSWDRSIILWDVTHGSKIFQLRQCYDYRSNISWNQSGDKFVSSKCVWCAKTGAKVASLFDYSNTIKCVAWSPDGSKIASVSHQRKVTIWDAFFWDRMWVLKSAGGAVTSLAWDPSGTTIASGHLLHSPEQSVILFDAATGDRTSIIKDTEPAELDAVTCLAWSRDGAVLAVGSVSTVSLRSAARPGGRRNSAHTLDSWHLGRSLGAVCSLAWSPDGSRLASASRSGGITVWDPWSRLATLTAGQRPGPASEVWSVAWAPDGSRIFSAGCDGVVAWDAESGARLAQLGARPERDGLPVSGAVLSPDGSRCAWCFNDAAALVWDAAAGAGDSEPAIRARAGRLCMAWSPDGRLLAAGAGDGELAVWDAGARARIVELRGHGGAVLAAAWSPDGLRLASAGADGSVRIWDSAGSDRRRRLALAMAFHPRLGRRAALAALEGDLASVVARLADEARWDPPVGRGFVGRGA